MICLTFDTDHMREDQLRRWMETCDIPGRGTIFCDRHYTFLDAQEHEVAPHPFISETTDWLSVVRAQRELYPKSTSWRSHSLFFSQTIAVELQRLGYDTVSVVEQFGVRSSAPYRLPWGPWQMPIYYMDNSDFCNFHGMRDQTYRPFDRALIESALTGDGVYVFDFHPIHLELNTPSYEFYAQNRDAFRDRPVQGVEPFQGYGTRSFFDELVSEMRRLSQFSTALCDVPR